ncbi:MAG: hypothetical protein U1E65_05345 [Myxococcota bacterium]
MTEYAVPENAFTFLEQGASGLLVWEGFDSIYNHALDRGAPAVPGNDDVGSVPLAFQATQPVSYTPRKEFYKNAQFFRFIPPGAVRIGAMSAFDAVAFHHVQSGRVSIVCQNTGGSARTVRGSLQNLPSVGAFSYVFTDDTHDLAPGADVAVTAGAFQFSIPAGAIVSLSSAAIAPADAGVSDAAPADAGAPSDAGMAAPDAAAPADAGMAPTDAGAPADAGAAPADAGTAPADAGAAPADAGQAEPDAAIEDATPAQGAEGRDGGLGGQSPGGGCGCGDTSSKSAALSLVAAGLLMRRARRRPSSRRR